MAATLTKDPQRSTIEELLDEQIDSGSSGEGQDAHLLENQLAQLQDPIRDTETLRRRVPAIEKLRELQEGWDGRDADPPSDDVLSHADALWRELDKRLPREFFRPTVKMARDGFISFSWIVPSPRKELHIWIRDEEPITYEIHLRTPSGKPLDKQDASLSDLFAAVGNFYRS